MSKILTFILKLCLLIALGIGLVDRPGNTVIVWQNYEINTSTTFLVCIIFACAYILFNFFRLCHYIKYGPISWRLNQKIKNILAGHTHFHNGLLSLANGDALEAGRSAVQARKKLGITLSTQFLQAQAAQLAGDHKAAHKIFLSLASEKETAALGYRGLIIEARQHKNWTEVDKLVEKFYRLHPKAPWINLIRFDLLARRQEWQEAHLTLQTLSKNYHFNTDKIKSFHSAVLVAISQEKAKQEHYGEALQYAELAIRQSPQWIVAIINLARQQELSGHTRASQRTITKYWATHPHPDLAALYQANIFEPLDAYKKIKQLCIHYPHEPVSLLQLADAALKANIWGEARHYLTSLINQGFTTKAVYRSLLRLEHHGTKNDPELIQWLSRSFEAFPDPIWLCCQCGGTHPEWSPRCSHCDEFNTIDWHTPGISHKINDIALQLASSWSE